ncbi:MAG: SpoIIIAC/SpoIIIAD family protein [Oscillospiraceae bacterium]
MIKLILIILISLGVILILKQYRPEFAFLFKIAVVLSAFAIILPIISEIFNEITDIFSEINIDFEYIIVLTKIVGISILSQIASDTCKDCGETALSSKIELVSKIIILGFSLPFVKSLIKICTEFMTG